MDAVGDKSRSKKKKKTVEKKPSEEVDRWGKLEDDEAKPQSTLPPKAAASVGKPLTGVNIARMHKPTDDIDFNEIVDEKPSNADLFKPAATASSGWEHSDEWGADGNDWGDDGGFASSKPKPPAAARDNAAKKAEIAALKVLVMASLGNK
ncbi:hypothetical protein AAVH_22199 [Aphelenchoides avenae]|nr:hypothetical protein AAVH_22199 [Aphelenchus avenae]